MGPLYRHCIYGSGCRSNDFTIYKDSFPSCTIHDDALLSTSSGGENATGKPRNEFGSGGHFQ